MPGDFREFFDARKLTDRQRGQIEFVLNSPAYEEGFKPYMLGILNSMTTLWRDRSSIRRDKYPDDFLAGGACFGEGLLKFFEYLIQETNLERIHASMEDVSGEDLYEMKRQRGEVRPIVGVDQPALPQRPDPEEY